MRSRWVVVVVAKTGFWQDRFVRDHKGLESVLNLQAWIASPIVPPRGGGRDLMLPPKVHAAVLGVPDAGVDVPCIEIAVTNLVMAVHWTNESLFPWMQSSHMPVHDAAHKANFYIRNSAALCRVPYWNATELDWE